MGADCFSTGANTSTTSDNVIWQALTTTCMRLGPRVSRQEMGVHGLLCYGHKHKNAKEQKKNTSTMASKMEPPMFQVLVY